MKKSVLLFLLICLTYLPSFGNQFVWDDEQFIQKNVFLTSVKYLPQIFTTNTIAGAGDVSNYYRPLTTLSFFIDRQVWGLTPFGFHLTNTLLHAGAAVVLFYLLVELGLGELAAFWIAAIFGLHPLQTEAVVYMNSRGDSLYALFLFGSLLCLQLALQRPKLPKIALMIGSLLLFIASVLSKEGAVAGLGLMGLLVGKDFVEKRLKFDAYVEKRIWESLLLIGGTTFVVIYFMLRSTVLNFANTFNYYGGQNQYTQSLIVRLQTFTLAFFEYLRFIFWPQNLHMERDLALVTSPLSWSVVGFGLFVVAIAALGWREWRKYQTLWVAGGFLWFLIMLVPVSGIIPINGLIYEHWLYVPLVGMGVAVWGLVRHFPPKIMAVVVVILALLTIRQNYIWRAPIPFYEYTLKFADSARLHNNLAMAYDEAGKYSLAVEQYSKAISLADVYPQTHYNLARTYVQMQRLPEAEAEYIKSLTLSPKFMPAVVDLLKLYLDQRRYHEALPLIQQLRTVYPNDASLASLYTATEKQATTLKTSP